MKLQTFVDQMIESSGSSPLPQGVDQTIFKSMIEGSVERITALLENLSPTAYDYSNVVERLKQDAPQLFKEVVTGSAVVTNELVEISQSDSVDVESDVDSRPKTRREAALKRVRKIRETDTEFYRDLQRLDTPTYYLLDKHIIRNLLLALDTTELHRSGIDMFEQVAEEFQLSKEWIKANKDKTKGLKPRIRKIFRSDIIKNNETFKDLKKIDIFKGNKAVSDLANGSVVTIMNTIQIRKRHMAKINAMETGLQEKDEEIKEKDRMLTSVENAMKSLQATHAELVEKINMLQSVQVKDWFEQALYLMESEPKLTQAEIAEKVGVSKDALKKRLFRHRKADLLNRE